MVNGNAQHQVNLGLDYRVEINSTPAYDYGKAPSLPPLCPHHHSNFSPRSAYLLRQQYRPSLRYQPWCYVYLALLYQLINADSKLSAHGIHSANADELGGMFALL